MDENRLPMDLDDGEMWLPSDIFLNEISSSPSASKLELLRRDHRLPFSCVDVDSLTNNLSTLPLLPLKPKTMPKIPMNLERFQQPVFCSANSPVPEYLLDLNNDGFDVGQRLYKRRTDPFLGVTEPVYQFQPKKPTQTQVERYLQLVRARVLMRQQTCMQNQVLPVQRMDRGLRVGGFVRESCGTGVFHPRHVHYSITNSSATTTTVGPIKMHGARNWKAKEILVTQQRKSVRREAFVSRNKQDGCHSHLPTDMGFPKNWTH